MDTYKTPTSKKSIGLFDSGVGGLTVLKSLLELMPHENYIYLGDTARLPYGTKSNETIIKYSLQASNILISRDIKLLVIACNTASSVALSALRAAYPHIPIIGVIEPGAQAACNATKNEHIAVAATTATTRGKAYVRAIKAIIPNARVESIACPLFVSLAEDGLTDGYIVEGIAQRYLQQIFNEDVVEMPDTLVLGCTHYPLLANAIQNVVGDEIKLVNSADTTALAVKTTLENLDIVNNELESKALFLTTDDTEQFISIGQGFLGEYIFSDNVELVDLM